MRVKGTRRPTYVASAFDDNEEEAYLPPAAEPDDSTDDDELQMQEPPLTHVTTCKCILHIFCPLIDTITLTLYCFAVQKNCMHVPYVRNDCIYACGRVCLHHYFKEMYVL